VKAIPSQYEVLLEKYGREIRSIEDKLKDNIKEFLIGLDPKRPSHKIVAPGLTIALLLLEGKKDTVEEILREIDEKTPAVINIVINIR